MYNQHYNCRKKTMEALPHPSGEDYVEYTRNNNAPMDKSDFSWSIVDNNEPAKMAGNPA